MHIPAMAKRSSLAFIAKFTIFSFLILTAPVTASATLIGLSGNVIEIAPPVSVLFGDLANDSTAVIFKEKSGVIYPGFEVLVSSQEAVDRELDFISEFFTEEDFNFFQETQTGIVEFPTVAGRPPIGTRMDSYFLHFQPIPLDDQTAFVGVSGSLTFDSDILGLQFADFNTPAAGELASSLMQLGSTNYPNTYIDTSGLPTGTEPEFAGVCADLGDIISISSDRRSIEFCFTANGSSDQFRIITAASENVPEPATLAIFGIGLLGLAGLRRRRKAI